MTAARIGNDYITDRDPTRCYSQNHVQRRKPRLELVQIAFSSLDIQPGLRRAPTVEPRIVTNTIFWVRLTTSCLHYVATDLRPGPRGTLSAL